MIVSTRTASNHLRYVKYRGVALPRILSDCHRLGVRVVSSGLTRKGAAWIVWDVYSAPSPPLYVGLN